VPELHRDDLVVCFKPDSEDIATEHFMGIVDMYDKEKTGLMIVKMKIVHGGTDERYSRLEQLLSENSKWVVLRVLSLQKWTKNYISVDSFRECLFQE
jgi:hypothetical protein